MKSTDFSARAELYLGSDRDTALQQGSRAFGSMAMALRFAFEQAAPVSLRGASLHVHGQTFLPAEMRRLYQSQDFPLARPKAAEPRRKRNQPFYGATLANAA